MIMNNVATVNYTPQQVINRLIDLSYIPFVYAPVEEKNGEARIIPFFMWQHVPKELIKAAQMYRDNYNNPFVRSAIIQFERENGILHKGGISYGTPHKSVIKKIMEAHKKNRLPFEWVIVNKASGTKIPEMLHIWKHSYKKGAHGRFIWHTLVNTGVLHSTPNGTWPIYQRLPRTTMRGVFPVPIGRSEFDVLKNSTVPAWLGSSEKISAVGMVSGSYVRWVPYNDPGILWVNYFHDGMGIHYYPRASYGFPQSAGCVEEPLANSKITYHFLHYGVPVTISAQKFSDQTT